jgi:hypothetical protein
MIEGKKGRKERGTRKGDSQESVEKSGQAKNKPRRNQSNVNPDMSGKYGDSHS